MASIHSFFKRKADGGGGGGGGSTGQPAAKAPRQGGVRWNGINESLLVREDGACEPSARIAAFDLDGTLQNPKPGRGLYQSTSPDDFELFSPEVKARLTKLHSEGHKLVIFSNQAGVGKKLEGPKATTVKARIDALSREVGVPLQAFCATQKSQRDPSKDPHRYHKPYDGMWHYMVKHCNKGVTPDLSRCFYVGDAAGRKGDHSDSDLGFARKVGIAFHTPEDFFDNKPVTAGDDVENPADTSSTPAAAVNTEKEAKALREDDELDGRNPDTP